MSDGIIGYKATISHSADSGVTWTKMPEVTSIDPADPQYDEAEFTHLESTGRRREFKPTFVDGGEVSVECNYVDKIANAGEAAKQAALRTLRDNGTVEYWKIEWRQNDTVGALLETCTFQAFVKSVKPGSITTTDPVKFSFVLRVTGAEVWT